MTADRPLAGRHVVTTRDRPGRLDTLLARLGADVIHVPLIAVHAPADELSLRSALADLDRASWLVVTSAHGARAVGEAAARHPRLRLAAVGARTADVLAALAGRPVDVVPDRQTAADLADAMPPGDGGTVVVAQADRADVALANGLAARGWRVRTVVAYHTRLRTPTGPERVAALAADALALASGSAAEAWSVAIGPSVPPVVVAIGPATAQAARRHGLKVTHVAADHQVEGLAATILSALA